MYQKVFPEKLYHSCGGRALFPEDMEGACNQANTHKHTNKTLPIGVKAPRLSQASLKKVVTNVSRKQGGCWWLLCPYSSILSVPHLWLYIFMRKSILVGEWYPGLASTAMIKYLDTKTNLSLEKEWFICFTILSFRFQGGHKGRSLSMLVSHITSSANNRKMNGPISPAGLILS